MKRRISDLPFVVEGRCLPVPSDASLKDNWSPVARFKSESDARLFMRAVSDRNGEEAMIDRLHTRLKNVNRIIKV